MGEGGTIPSPGIAGATPDIWACELRCSETDLLLRLVLVLVVCKRVRPLTSIGTSMRMQPAGNKASTLRMGEAVGR